MKKITKKDLEMLSAYIDGELSEDEIVQIEKLLIESGEFNREYQELKKIKTLTSLSYTTLPETQFFETKLMQTIHSDNAFGAKLKKWSPAIGFSILAIFMMVILKLNPNILDQLAETPKSTIAGFYKQNLQPLLYAADLSNEDIFNFAFYKQLPLDKSKKQYIFIGTDSIGNEYFEIKKPGDIPDENNLVRFVTALNLDDNQILKIDSIIGYYAEELESQILINEDHTVAINPNLWNYNKALVADLVAFASANKSRELVRIIPAGLHIDTHSINLAVNQIKENKNNDYIFMTQDTIFSENFHFDKEKFKKEMEVIKKNLEKTKKNINEQIFSFNFNVDSNFIKLKKDSAWKKNFSVTFDSSLCRVKIPRIVIPNTYLNTDSILTQVQLNKITEKLRDFKVELPKGFLFKGGDLKFNYSDGDSIHNYKFKLNAMNIDSIVKSSLKILDSLDIRMPKKFNFNFDSLQIEKFKKLEKLNYLKSDSLNKVIYRELEKQLHNKLDENHNIMDRLKKNKELKKSKNWINVDTVKT